MWSSSNRVPCIAFWRALRNEAMTRTGEALALRVNCRPLCTLRCLL